MSHSSLPVALLASHLPCGSLWAAPKAPLGPRFPSGQFASLTRLEKALYCPFLKEGVRNVARRLVGEIIHAIVRARAHSFPLSKRARLFPSAAYRRSAPPQLALGRLSQRELGYYVAAWVASLHRETGLIFFPLRLALCLLNQRRLGCFAVTWIFLQRKRPAWVQIHTGLLCKP